MPIFIIIVLLGGLGGYFAHKHDAKPATAVEQRCSYDPESCVK